MAEPLAIDFETVRTGTYSVRNLGNWRYAHDPRFRAMLVACSDAGDLQAASDPAAFDWQTLHGRALVAHNAGFDRAVFERLQELGTVPEDIRPQSWDCTAALCAYFGLPRDLANAARELFGVRLDKTIRNRIGAQQDLFDDTAAYGESDAYWCARIWQKLSPQWPERERRLARITDEMGRRGLALDTAGLRQARERLAEDTRALEKAIPWRPAASLKQLAEHCAAIGVPPPKTTTDGVALDRWIEKHAATEAPTWVRHLQRLRRTRRTLAVVDAMLERAMPDGRMAYQLKYFGAAQTGRWSGGGGLNLQNLNRAEAAGVDLRQALVPEPGHVFLIADYAQVEARVTLWLAGDWAMLRELRSGMDLYEAAARRIFGYSDSRPVKVANPRLRQLAKAVTLGCGFGMGPQRFVTAARTLAGLDLSFPESKRAVADFRAKNPAIVALWSRLERAFKARHGGTYSLPLPSGRRIRYWDVDSQEFTARQVKGGPVAHLHPGMLAENMVQATARDLLANAWLAAEDAGLRVVLTVHDELIVEHPEATAPEALRALEAAMLGAAAGWQNAELLPLAVDTRTAKEYGK